MKNWFRVLFLLTVLCVCYGCGKGPADSGGGDPEYSDFAGIYLGQITPGTIPARFASGILLANTTRWWHDAPAFSPDGQSLFMSFYDTGNTPPVGIDFMEVKADQWTLPETASFSGVERDNGPRFSIDGDRLFFSSRRAGGAVFTMERVGEGWSAPVAVIIPGNASDDFTGISVTRDETLYFGDANSGHLDIYRSRKVGGQYDAPENLGAAINSDDEDWGPYIDPDEHYLIFTSNRPGGYGMHDLYISFNNQDGSWTDAQNMGTAINSANEDASPLISPEGEYLFFLTQKSSDAGLNPYWVDAQIIENFRPAVPLDGRGGGVIAYCYQPLLANTLHQIYAINGDGSGNKKLVESTIGLNHHDWSPDGQKLAAVGYVAPQTTWSIYAFNADGTNLTRLTFQNNVLDNEPNWSPDGTQIVFTRVYPGENDRFEIRVMDTDGSNQHAIGIAGFAAKWSPDGTRFVYQSSMVGSSDIYTCAIDGSDVQQLLATTASEINPVYSPDGTRIAFGTDQDGNHEIYIMNADGTNLQRLTDSAYDDYTPRWSPDGSLIAFDSGPAEQWEVYIINADGTGLRRLTHSPPNITAINPVWRPAIN